MSTLYFSNVSTTQQWELAENWFTDEAGTIPALNAPWVDGTDTTYLAYNLTLATGETEPPIMDVLYHGINFGTGATGTAAFANLNNNGAINGGVYSGDAFINSGTINGGLFSGDGYNNNDWIAGGIFTGNYFVNYDYIVGGTYTGDGLTNNGTIPGGEFTGNDITNYGTVGGYEFSGLNFTNYGNIDNGIFTGANFINNVEGVISYGNFSGPNFGGNGTINGGVFTGAQFNGFPFENENSTVQIYVPVTDILGAGLL